MKRILHISASPRGEESRTAQIAEAFLDQFIRDKRDWVIDRLNLAREELPSLTAKQVGGKYVLLEGKELYGRLKEEWGEIVQHIERFKTGDFYLISAPMWNFSIPYMLKQYIDLIVQPKFMFRFQKGGGAEGLIKNKSMVVATSSGGLYTGEASGADFFEPYLRAVFGLVGISDIRFIKAEGMDRGAKEQKEALSKAIHLAEILARRYTNDHKEYH